MTNVSDFHKVHIDYHYKDNLYFEKKVSLTVLKGGTSSGGGIILSIVTLYLSFDIKVISYIIFPSISL